MKLTIKLTLVGCLYTFLSQAQCPDCGNGIANPGETFITCPSDVPHGPTCTAGCAQPRGGETATGIRKSLDFVGTTTYSTTGLPAGWSFGSATSNTTLPTADAFGPKGGLVDPNATGITTATIGNGFSEGGTGGIGASVTVGTNGQNGQLGANFDGRPNVAQNASYAILRGSGSPTLISETYNMSNVNGFKIQFWLAPSVNLGTRTLTWGSCTGNAAFLDFSANGGTTWTQIMKMDVSTATDNCSNPNSNTKWLKDGQWNRICLTVYKSTNSPGNYYPAADENSAPQGMMVNSAYFTSNFRFRIRYEQSSSCNITPTATTTSVAGNSGRYLAIDYPVVTSGNEMIPCGISFINTCGYGLDDNDDGVGSSTATTTYPAFGTLLRSVNHAERGVEIFNSQNSSFGAVNTSGSSFATNYDLCNAEGGDRQCIDWQANNNTYSVVYECVTDWEPSSNIQLKYYKGTTAQSLNLTKVTAAGKTAAIGWRHSGTLYVNCSSSDLNPGCNGYQFTTTSLPTKGFARTFYNLATNNLGEAWSFYGASSCSNYFNGPSLAPIATPVEVEENSNFLACTDIGAVISAKVDYCSSSGFTGSSTVTVSGPGGFSETIVSGQNGTVQLTAAGEYTIKAQTPTTPTQCIDCGRTVCITVTQAEIENCFTPLPVGLIDITGIAYLGTSILDWITESDENTVYYVVERSNDGVYYNEIGRVAADKYTNAKNYYQYTDRNAPFGLSYYRLRLVDTQGKSNFTKAIVIKHQATSLQVHPNPSNGNIFIQGLDGKENHIELIDLNGKKVFETQTQKEEIQLQLQQEPGIYFLHIRGVHNNQTVRIVIQS